MLQLPLAKTQALLGNVAFEWMDARPNGMQLGHALFEANSRRWPHQHMDVAIATCQLAHQVTPDKSSRARDEICHRLRPPGSVSGPGRGSPSPSSCPTPSCSAPQAPATADSGRRYEA